MSALKRVIGLVLLVIAAISLVLSLAAIVGAWSLRRPLADRLSAGLTLLDDTLASTDKALAVVDESLQAASASIGAAQSTFQSLSKTIDGSAPAVAATADLLSKQLPGTLRSAQEALAASAESAKVVDGALQLLSGLPLVRIEYNPDVPLSDALNGISTSLQGMPDGLAQLGRQLTPTVQNLPILARSLGELGTAMAQVQANLASARQIMTSYQGLILRYQESICTVQDFVPTLILAVPIAVTFFAFWLAVVQFFALLKGWEWLAGRPEPQPVAVVQPVALPQVTSGPAPALVAARVEPASSPAPEAEQDEAPRVETAQSAEELWPGAIVTWVYRALGTQNPAGLDSAFSESPGTMRPAGFARTNTQEKCTERRHPCRPSCLSHRHTGGITMKTRWMLLTFSRRGRPVVGCLRDTCAAAD